MPPPMEVGTGAFDHYWHRNWTWQVKSDTVSLVSPFYAFQWSLNKSQIYIYLSAILDRPFRDPERILSSSN